MTTRKKYSYFDCANIEKYAQLFIDGQLSEIDQKLFKEHLDYCLPCDKKIEFEQKLKDILRLRARESEIDVRLADRLKALFNDLK